VIPFKKPMATATTSLAIDTRAIAREFASVPAVEQVYVEPIGDAIGLWVVLRPCSMEAQKMVFAVERLLHRKYRQMHFDVTIVDGAFPTHSSDFSRSSLSYQKSA
jgi:hypothetical protein